MRRIDGWSLQRRLLGGLCCILAVIAGGLYFTLAAYASRAADRAFDQLLLASALSIADALQFEDGAITIDLPVCRPGDPGHRPPRPDLLSDRRP